MRRLSTVSVPLERASGVLGGVLREHKQPQVPPRLMSVRKLQELHCEIQDSAGRNRRRVCAGALLQPVTGRLALRLHATRGRCLSSLRALYFITARPARVSRVLLAA